jgi:hypothetical protein
MLFLSLCPDPDCGAPAEVLDRILLRSTTGPIEHAKVQCARRHIFVMPTPPANVSMDPILRPPVVTAEIGRGTRFGPGTGWTDSRRPR